MWISIIFVLFLFCSGFGEWEKHTKGFGKKLLEKVLCRYFVISLRKLDITLIQLQDLG